MTQRKTFQLLSIQWALIFVFFTSQADEVDKTTRHYSPLVSDALAQTRFVIDYSLRLNMNLNSDHSSQMHFLGFDFFRNFSVNGKDVGV